MGSILPSDCGDRSEKPPASPAPSLRRWALQAHHPALQGGGCGEATRFERGSFDAWEGRFSNRTKRAFFGINKDETHEKSSNVRSYSHTFRVKLRMVFSMGFVSWFGFSTSSSYPMDSDGKARAHHGADLAQVPFPCSSLGRGCLPLGACIDPGTRTPEKKRNSNDWNHFPWLEPHQLRLQDSECPIDFAAHDD